MKHKPRHHLSFATLRLEGGLFLPDQLEKAALGAARFQSEADYHTPKGLKLKDDTSRAFQIASAQWKHFADQFERNDIDADALTRHFVQELLRDAFGYTHIAPVTGLSVGDQHYPVALLIFGEGFIQHPANEALRQALDTGTLSADAYFQQLLRLIYRLIFLFNVEERGLLHPADDCTSAIAARGAYAEGYAVGRLRDLCLKRRARNRFDDHWQALCIVFKGLAEGEPRLARLFAASQCPALDTASLDNAHLLAAMQQLRWSNHSGSLAPVDYRNLGSEELGSVYESLLELVPDIDLPARKFGFIGMGDSEGSTAGNARKLTGSYYTPDALVQELIRSALDPVIAQRLSSHPANPVEALLSMRVIDPACGSGHFLLAAARRLAEQLAQLRAPDGEYSRKTTATPCAKSSPAAFSGWTAIPWPSNWRAPLCGWKVLKKAAP